MEQRMTQLRSTQDVRLSGTVAVVGAIEHPHAARRLREALPTISWQSARDEDVRTSTLPVVELKTRADLDEGVFDLAIQQGAGAPRITIAGGPFSGVIYGVEEIIRATRTMPAGAICLQISTGVRTPALAHRAFWTWDHSSNWQLDQIGHQEIGVFNPYGKPPAGFLEDYTRMVDFCSQNRIGAIIVYGFLRDSHGGIESAQELCRYANERGVRILPGLAIGAYGGVYWEGKHRYNLSHWLSERPEGRAQTEGDIGFWIEDLAFPLSFPHSDYTLSACPSDPAMMDWMEDAVSWLAETFDIGGVNVESGDYGVCGCSRCSARRGDRESSERRQEMIESWSHADLADNFPRLFRAVKERRPNAWVYSELQWDNLLDESAAQPLGGMPAGALYQHTMNRGYWNRVRSEFENGNALSFPTSDNIVRAHFGSQWNGDRRTDRYRNNVGQYQVLTQSARQMGFVGATVWGEASPHHVPVELSYLAFANYAFDANMTPEQFLRDHVAPRLGGEAMAIEYLEILERVDEHTEPTIDTMGEMRERALAGFRSSSGEVADRWVWLADHIARRRRAARS